MNERLFEEQKHDIDYWKLYDNKMQNQRKHIIKFIVFSMLYLFYNANLLKSCENVKLRFNAIEFVNDINIFMYNKSMKQNCEMLKKTWNKVVEWTKKHDFKFNKRKHALIHFSRISKRYNINARITLRKYWTSANIDFKILKVQLNFKLK